MLKHGSEGVNLSQQFIFNNCLLVYTLMVKCMWVYLLFIRELWMEVHDIVREAAIKTIPKKKNCKKAKWLSEETSQIAVKRREAKGKGEKEIYTHLNAES